MPRHKIAYCESFNSIELHIKQPLGMRSAYNTIMEDPGSPYVAMHITMYNLLPVYIPCFLPALSLTHFISKIPIKDQQKDLLFYCPAILDL